MKQTLLATLKHLPTRVPGATGRQRKRAVMAYVRQFSVVTEVHQIKDGRHCGKLMAQLVGTQAECEAVQTQIATHELVKRVESYTPPAESKGGWGWVGE